MPTITIDKSDLERLAGKSYDLPELQTVLEYAKAEVKAEGDELRVQLKDTNRPDLWCCEGLARAIKGYRESAHPDYAFFASEDTGDRAIQVDAALEQIRPYVAGFVTRGFAINDETLKQLIDTQKRLSENYGRGRAAIAIGIYDASDLVYPIRYEAADPDAISFQPLESDSVMSLRSILNDHPMGQAYAHLLEGNTRFPLLRDARDEVLSMPPVINSSTLGRVKVGDSHLFVEATGTELDLILHAISIFAVNFADRGATVEPVAVDYQYDTPRGTTVVTPVDLGRAIEAPYQTIEKMAGTKVAADDAEVALIRMGYREVELLDEVVRVVPPPYRDDLMHPVDVIEDIIIAIGYEAFEPEMPCDFTIGKAAPVEDRADRFRHLMVGAGFQEVFLPILGSTEDRTSRMRDPDGSIVEISNPMSEYYSSVRSSLIPGLLRVEERSRRSIYPHRVFEVGEVARFDETENHGTRTDIVLASMEAMEDANLSGVQSYLEALAYYLHFEYELRPIEHPTYLPGRAGEIVSGGTSYGIIGEIHPEVLHNWGIAVPVSVFEVDTKIGNSP